MNKTKKICFGIVQGRLTKSPQNELQWFPQDNWQKEISLLSEVNIDFIELLVEREFNKNNPFWSKDGRKKICDVHSKNNIKILSICNDYIINNSITNLRTQDQVKLFIELSAEIKCKKIILPLLEESSLNTDTFNQYIPIIKKFSAIARDYNIKICIETLLNGSKIKEFIEEINEENVKLVFDTGNRVIEKRDLENEIILLNKLIDHVHIKDKNINGENVLLGTGLVNFEKVFLALNQINYLGPYVFETTRGNNPLETAKFHFNLCNFFKKNAELSE